MPTTQKNEIIIRIPRPSGRGALKMVPRFIGFGATVALAVLAAHGATAIQWLVDVEGHIVNGSLVALAASFWLREIMDSRR